MPEDEQTEFHVLRPEWLLIFFACSSFAQGVSRQPAGLGCIEHINLPGYPALARSSGISGKVTVVFNIDNAGNAENLKITADHHLLRPLVQLAVESAKFLQRCSGRKAKLIWKFVLTREQSEYSKPSVTYKHPDTILVNAPMAMLNID